MGLGEVHINKKYSYCEEEFRFEVPMKYLIMYLVLILGISLYFWNAPFKELVVQIVEYIYSYWQLYIASIIVIVLTLGLIIVNNWAYLHIFLYCKYNKVYTNRVRFFFRYALLIYVIFIHFVHFTFSIQFDLMLYLYGLIFITSITILEMKANIFLKYDINHPNPEPNQRINISFYGVLILTLFVLSIAAYLSNLGGFKESLDLYIVNLPGNPILMFLVLISLFISIFWTFFEFIGPFLLRFAYYIIDDTILAKMRSLRISALVFAILVILSRFLDLSNQQPALQLGISGLLSIFIYYYNIKFKTIA